VSTYILLVVTTFHNKHKNSVIARGTDRFFRKYCVSQVAFAVAKEAVTAGLSKEKYKEDEIEERIREAQWIPEYLPYQLRE
jgi:malic enzyme